MDNAAGRDMAAMTAQETYELFEMLGANSQQKSARRRRAWVNKVCTNHELTRQLAELTKQVQLLAVQEAQSTPTHEVCGICSGYGHGANICNALGETFVEKDE